jgi:hypothetical protein
MKALWLLALLAVPVFAGEPFDAHEWGTFTTIAGKDGVAIEWQPFAGEDDLPNFVYDLTDLSQRAGVRHNPFVKSALTARVRMETPVIYFYAPREMEVSVKVDFPEGKITEWYPRARSVHAGIDWGRVRLMPGVTTNYPVESARAIITTRGRQTRCRCGYAARPVRNSRSSFSTGAWGRSRCRCK